MLGHLDAHFAQHPYLLGAVPTLADFALAGPMLGHLGRDPWPAREWVAPRQHLAAWIERMRNPGAIDGTCAGARPRPQAADPEALTLAPTLAPVLDAIADEFLPLLKTINAQVQARLASGRAVVGQTLPRALGDVTIRTAQGPFSRRALPYTLWMAQRVRDQVDALPRRRGPGSRPPWPAGAWTGG